MSISQSFRKFADDDSGATAIEYALIASIVSIAIAAALANVKSSLQESFNDVSAGIDGAL